MRKIGIAMMMAATLTFTTVTLPISVTKVNAAVMTPNLEIVGENLAEMELIPGTSREFSVPIRAKGLGVNMPVFSVTLPENAPFEITKVSAKTKVGDTLYPYSTIAVGQTETAVLCFTVTTKESAKIGRYPIVFSYEDAADQGFDDFGAYYSKDLSMTAVISQEKLPAEPVVTDMVVEGETEPGNTVKISFSVQNSGEITAKNVCVSADYSSTDLLPTYTDLTKKLGDLKKDEKDKVTLSVKIMDSAQSGLCMLPLVVTYVDSDGARQTIENAGPVYMEIKSKGKTQEKFNNGELLIQNVVQSPQSPTAGEKVTMTFDVTNTGSRDYTNAKLAVRYESGSGFEPINSDPYRYIGTIPAGKKVTVSVTVLAGAKMPAGMNMLGITISYLDGNEESSEESVNIPVLHVVSKEESMISGKPRLMVTEFSTGEEIIKAGEEFPFCFTVMNTHSETAAKNIKVTVNSDNFAVTKGSNSFFVADIPAGGQKDFSVNLKASAATETGSYNVNIRLEYEYDGMPMGDSLGDGVVVVETKAIPLKENLRVSFENIAVGGWDVPIVGNPTSLAFTVYNMGRSQLNNVYFTVEGDFTIANGTSYYYGTLQPGYPDYVEVEVIPLCAGASGGVITVHMEDSNGDEVTKEEEFTADVLEDMGFGTDEPFSDIDIGDIENKEPAQEKKPMNPWLYAGILAAALLLGLFVTRGIVLAVHKKKEDDF